MNVVWTEAAARDVERIANYITLDNPAAARRVARELLLAGDSLTMFPHRGRHGRLPGTRELVAVFPYVIIYSVAPEKVDILRVWHGAQDHPA